MYRRLLSRLLSTGVQTGRPFGSIRLPTFSIAKPQRSSSPGQSPGVYLPYGLTIKPNRGRADATIFLKAILSSSLRLALFTIKIKKDHTDVETFELAVGHRGFDELLSASERQPTLRKPYGLLMPWYPTLEALCSCGSCQQPLKHSRHRLARRS